MKPLSTQIAGLALCLIGSGPAMAAPVTIDFEGSFYATNPITEFQDASATVTGTISVASRTNAAWIYDTDSTGGRDPDLEAPFYNAADRASDPDASGLTGRDNFDNALIIQESGASVPDDEAQGGTVTFLFGSAVNLFSIDILDASLGKVSFKLFDSSDALLESFANQYNSDSDRQPNWYETVLFGTGVTDVKRLEVQMNNVSGAIDNIVVSPVPIPAAVWLFASALGVFGYLGKRKQAA